VKGEVNDLDNCQNRGGGGAGCDSHRSREHPGGAPIVLPAPLPADPATEPAPPPAPAPHGEYYNPNDYNDWYNWYNAGADGGGGGGGGG